MAQLQDLPAEILYAIFAYTPAVDALRSLCLVSKKLCGVAQPLLHQEVFLDFPDPTASSLRTLSLLARTAVSCRFLAARIRRIVLHFAFDGELIGHARSLIRARSAGLQSHANHSRIVTPIMSSRIPQDLDIIDWYSRIIASASILFANAFNLENLTAPTWFCSLKWLTTLFSTPIDVDNKPPPLEGLRLLRLVDTDSGRANRTKLSLTDIMPLLSLPQLDKIHVDNCCGHIPGISSYLLPEHAPPGTFNFSEISFRYSCVDAISIHTLIAACKSLQCFDYLACASPFNQFNPLELSSALNCQQNSLKRLDVSFYDNLEVSANVRFWGDMSYGSFLGFSNLEALGLDQVFSDVLPDLPPSLKTFGLRNCYAPVYHTIFYLAQKVDLGAMPLLKEVYLSTDVLAPGKMLDLPSRGATDVLFYEACNCLENIFAGTYVSLRFESDLLSHMVHDYSFAFEFDRSGQFWPLIYLK